MNDIIVTYDTQFAIVRFYAGADNDIALTLVGQTLIAAGYALTRDYNNTVLSNSNQYYLAFSRAAAIPALVPPAIDGVTWVDAPVAVLA